MRKKRGGERKNNARGEAAGKYCFARPEIVYLLNEREESRQPSIGQEVLRKHSERHLEKAGYCKRKAEPERKGESHLKTYRIFWSRNLYT